MASPEPLPAGLPVFQRVLLPRYTQGYPLLDASHPQLSCGHCWMLLCVIFSSTPLLGRCSSFLRLQLTAQTKHTDRHTDSSCKPPFPTDSPLSFPTVPSITHTHTHISPRAHAPPSRVQGSREKPKPVSLQTFHLLPVPNFIVAQQPSSLVWRPTSSPFPWVRVPPVAVAGLQTRWPRPPGIAIFGALVAASEKARRACDRRYGPLLTGQALTGSIAA